MLWCTHEQALLVRSGKMEPVHQGGLLALWRCHDNTPIFCLAVLGLCSDAVPDTSPSLLHYLSSP